MQVVRFGGMSAMDFESVTVSTTAVGLTETKYKKAMESAGALLGAKSAFITVEDNPIRFSVMAGVTPTASTNGHEMGAGTSFELHGATQMANFKAIRTGGADGVLHITYFE